MADRVEGTQQYLQAKATIKIFLTTSFKSILNRSIGACTVEQFMSGARLSDDIVAFKSP